MSDELDLQAVLDESILKASASTRKIFAPTQWSAGKVTAYINAQQQAAIGTTCANGRPQLSTAIAGMWHGVLYFSLSDPSQMLVNIRRTGEASFCAMTKTESVFGWGAAAVEGPVSELSDLLSALAAATSSDRFTPEGWDGYIGSIRASRIFAG